MDHIKARLYSIFKRNFVPDELGRCENEAMLTREQERAALAMRFQQAVEASDHNYSSLAEAIGVTPQAAHGWKKSGKMSKDSGRKVAEALGVSVEWLLYGDGRPPGTTGADEPTRAQKALSDPGVEWLLIAPDGEPTLEDSVGRPVARDRRRRGVVPLVDYVEAGMLTEVCDPYALGDGHRQLPVSPDTWEKLGRGSFALEVRGKSMEPDFREGDYVIIDPAAAWRPGDYVVAKVESRNEATLKKIRDRGLDDAGEPILELHPMNPDFPVITINASNPGWIIGPVVEYHRRLR